MILFEELQEGIKNSTSFPHVVITVSFGTEGIDFIKQSLFGSGE